MLNKILIRLFLISQAAHEPAAAAGDLGRVEGKRLHLSHFCGHGLKIIKKLTTAVRPAADAEAAHHFRLVAHADLPELNAVAEYSGKILYKLTEVDTPVGGEEESGLAALKVALDVNELHVKPVLDYLLLADLKGLAFTPAVELGDPQIVLRGDAHRGTQRLHDGCLRHRVVSPAAVGDLKSL